MIQIDWDPEDGFCIIQGVDEFLERIEKNSTVKVSCASDGKNYYVHEVGEQVHLLNQEAQNALAKLADLLIRDIATKRLH